MGIYLQENEIIIRSIRIDDANLIYKWWNDGNVMAHAGFPEGLKISLDEIQRKIEEDSDKCRRLVMEYKHVPIGEMSYRILGKDRAVIGIKICDFSMQEKGIGTRCIKQLIEFLFDRYEIEAIELDTNLNNKRAQHVYEKIGFQKIRIRENAWTDQVGKLQSSVDYILTRNLFFSNKESINGK